MTPGTNGQDGQAHQRPMTRSTKREVLIYGFAGMALAVAFVVTFPSSNEWYLVLGSCVMAVMAVVYVSMAIIALRRNDSVTILADTDTDTGVSPGIRE